MSDAEFTRAVELHRAGLLDAAAEIYRAFSAAGGPLAGNALVNLGVLCDEQGRYEEALQKYREALALHGGNWLAWNNMGNSLMRQGRFAEASGAFRQALALAPDCLEARLGLGAALQRDGDAPGAIACFRETLRRDPYCAEAHWNLALALLISGEFPEGWREYQWRWRRESFTSPRRGFSQPLWDGSLLAGRRLLVHAEQGLGDTIQFVRYLPLLSSAGGSVFLECQSPSLLPLLQGIPGVSGVYLMGEALPEFDLQVPLLSLPHLFRTTIETLPDQVPYLSAAPDRLATWEGRIVSREELKVGIVWAGKPFPDPFRSCRLADLAPLGAIPGVTLYSLQLPSGSAESGDGLNLVDLTPHVADFADTAALVSLLDLVISVDTSVAHLAGALGKPVWLLLPRAGDYRWLLQREDSPWYPSMRIFRQELQGEWGPVMERVSGELRELAARYLERSAAADPLNGRRAYLYAAFLASVGRHREAAVRFSKAAELLPGSWQSHFGMGQSLQIMGLLPEAEASLKAAIALRDDLPLLHEALGVVRQLQGELDEAMACYRAALKLDPTLVKATDNLAICRRDRGMVAEAAQGLPGAVALAPDHAEASEHRAGALERLKGSGLSLSGEGRHLEAAQEFRRALALAPSDLELHNYLGCALDDAGRHGEAVEIYLRALAVAEGFMPLHYNMGNSLQALGRSAEAAQSYRRALVLDPSLSQGWHNLALSLQDLGKLEEAKHALERALQLRPEYLEARHNLGELQHRIGEVAAAEAIFREVLARNPGYLPSWNALGITYQAQERLEEAIDCYLKALSINPDYLHALNNLGAANKELGLPERAVACYQRVLALEPAYADARWNLALVQLLLGRYREGWQGYECRFRKVDVVVEQRFPQPRWDGGALKGKVVLLHAEQGFGDTIQFVRYATLLARKGGRVVVQCQTRAIAPVVATVPGVAQVLVRGAPLPHFDLHAPLMSLPLLCDTDLATIPAEVPYLRPDAKLVQLWGARIPRGGLRIGLAWAGRRSYKDDQKRSLNLQLFAPLAGVAGVRLYSLQVGEGADQAAAPPPGMEITDLGKAIGTFADTAAIIDNLDLVISADTAVAHLAGALGKPVWVLLPMACDWRWLLEREDSPWYPTARLFRQRRRGDWVGVLERVARELAALAREGR